MPLPVSMFCVMRDDPAPLSHTPYEYLVPVPFRSIGPVIVGTGGRTKRRICDNSNLVDMRVLFTLDNKCFVQLFGSKPSIISALEEIRQIVYRAPSTYWNTWEASELRRRDDGWTRWANQRAERISGAWLLDRYSSSFRPAAQLDSQGARPLPHGMKDDSTIRSDRRAPPGTGRPRFISAGGQYSSPARGASVREKQVLASRSPPRRRTPRTPSPPRPEIKAPTLRVPDLQQEQSSSSSMDIDSANGDAQANSHRGERDWAPSGRKQVTLSNPAAQQRGIAHGRVKEQVSSHEPDDGGRTIPAEDRRRPIDKVATPRKSVTVA